MVSFSESSALLLQISETSTLHWLQSAQVSWLGLCGPETSPWSAGTSLHASIECHADGRETLFHPFSLVGCQGCCKLSFLPFSAGSSPKYEATDTDTDPGMHLGNERYCVCKCPAFVDSPGDASCACRLQLPDIFDELLTFPTNCVTRAAPQWKGFNCYVHFARPPTHSWVHLLPILCLPVEQGRLARPAVPEKRVFNSRPSVPTDFVIVPKC